MVADEEANVEPLTPIVFLRDELQSALDLPCYQIYQEGCQGL